MEKNLQDVGSSCCHGVKEHASKSIKHELLCHFPYAVYAVALSMVLVALITVRGALSHAALHGLFHTLHFLHIVFAATGTVLVYRKYNGGIFGSLFVGSIVPAIFCTLSDAVMPYLGGVMYGIDMEFHWCFRDHLGVIIPFLLVGIINGIVLSLHDSAGQDRYAATSHFLHIFISALASTMYMIGHGFAAWQSSVSYLFLFLLFAVLIPCTFADVIVPVWCGSWSSGRKKGEKK
jgi:hypothetical protein